MCDNGKKLSILIHTNESQSGWSSDRLAEKMLQASLLLLQCSCSAEDLGTQNYQEVLHLAVAIFKGEDY